ncbi:ribonuclease domain-containing protein [Elizabethkingia meningoseptica]|uniref:ribonuclease domain-containing protein n=1 Tax=Elizabethkingia meningoseptica TaxID=238 RepID=UPI0009378264|nr:ribonuclease domain-containing protein [Elizabethkingia meningoseptica]MCL1676406.1 ribonuclease [Elizabethkingia meningoseptica]MCL1687880.1 ribonuclease [Elizabethkingia meningoseptica]MDE5488017.1 ribonuclease [Elizabethkingia meningoseptica]MVW91056.1 ribonuclease [Elizabethkingia meningoseptica]
MNSKFLKTMILFVVAFSAGIGMMYMINKNTGKRMPTSDELVNYEPAAQKSGQESIAQLTAEKVVVDYVKKNKKLPDYYITKREAREKGWQPSKGNLCEVLPGRAIGGDYFSNREGRLPKEQGRKYFEADVNYDCGRRDAERLVFSNDGMVFISKDHYKSFEQK